LPKEIVDRFADGESPIRVLREWRGITQLHLAAKASLSQGYISDIENGRRVGTAGALRTLAKILNVPVDLLID
jgi:transcriptional regulator with XRE-family HTH domain